MGELVLLGVVQVGVQHVAFGVVAADEVVADLVPLLLVDRAEDAAQDQVFGAALHVDQGHESARGGIVAAGHEGVGGIVVGVDADDLSREGLHQAHRAVGHHEHIDGEAHLAGALTLSAQSVGKLSVRGEDVDLRQLGVQQVDVALLVGDDAGDQAEDVLLVVDAAHAPEFLELERLYAVARLGAVADVGHAVDHGLLGRERRECAEGAQDRAEEDESLAHARLLVWERWRFRSTLPRCDGCLRAPSCQSHRPRNPRSSGCVSILLHADASVTSPREARS